MRPRADQADLRQIVCDLAPPPDRFCFPFRMGVERFVHEPAADERDDAIPGIILRKSRRQDALSARSCLEQAHRCWPGYSQFECHSPPASVGLT